MKKGDGVLLHNVGFGAILHVGPESGLIMLQNMNMVELSLSALAAGAESARRFCCFISSEPLS